MMIFNNRRVFFTSDWHYNHNKSFVWEYRGFKSVREHNEELIKSINNTVEPNDVLYNLGDLCLNASVEDFEFLISSIRCQNMYLLWGNHPNKHLKQIYKPLVQSILGKLYSEEHQIYPLRYKNIIYIGDYAEIVVNGQFITLSHFPFSVWHKMEKSSWHLCGHSHYNFQPSMAEDSTSKILDVGWDGHKKPWSFEEVAEVMATKSVPVVDHHV